MYQSGKERVAELKRIIEDAQRELYHLEWQVRSSDWNHPPARVCTMLQGHPSHCGCGW